MLSDYLMWHHSDRIEKYDLLDLPTDRLTDWPSPDSGKSLTMPIFFDCRIITFRRLWYQRNFVLTQALLSTAWSREENVSWFFFLRIWPYDDTSRIILNLQSCLDCCWFTLFLYHLVLMSWEGRIGLISLGKGEPKCAWAPHQSLPCAKHTRWTESHSRKQSACCHCHHCNSILLFSPASNCRLPCHSVLQSV